MRKLTLALLSFIFLALPASAEPVLYLVRHAEKVADGSRDPALTPEGLKRAEWLAGYFEDKDIKTVLSTDYKRTQQTAAPTAAGFGLEVESYDPSDLNELAKQLKGLEGPVLVLGHSNTTPVLAGILLKDPMEELDERVYDHIYVLTPGKGGYSLRVDYSEPRTALPEGE
ncbi:SixA phosphatase family protein [Kordiimonas gwangyangensis]|uniref:SixA phosphatase family protein n=1 Tax=Kordiimonas gwangyangensis TaxID=288022 RepID=UPI00036DABD4|nr:histidine phosphatase family protein [Kordiimonas gwangyangensis]